MKNPEKEIKMSEIRLGPAGIGGFHDAPAYLEEYSHLGISCAEIPFTYGVWLDNKQAEEIGKIAEKFNIQLSIHAPYYINLDSQEKAKVEASMKRILDSCEKAHFLKAKYVVFHAAFYGKKDPKEVYNIVKKHILEMQKIIKKNNWQVSLAPETTGKPSQFGTLKELLLLRKETGCFFCIDFAHLEARNGKENYKEVLEELKKNKIEKIHCHFSGIEYGEKGEKRHVVTEPDKLKRLLSLLKKSQIEATFINESPSPVEDSLKALKILKSL
jgi:deoxyribonuclease IV